MTDRKILSGVLITAFSLSMILGTMPNASAKNNLQSIDGVNKTAIAAAERAAFLLSMPSKTKILDKYENATSLTDSQLVELLKAVGFKGQGLKMAWAVAKAESNGRPFAFNGNPKTGDSSYGIFQINMLGTLGPDRRDKFDLDLNAELFSPVKNAEIVFHMTQGGEDWSSWSSYKKGAVAKWLHKFPNQ